MSTTPVAPTYKSGKGSVAPADSSTPQEARGAAFQFLSELAAEVSSGTVDLPCFPDVVLRIRNALADPTTTPERTVTIVGAEPRPDRAAAANSQFRCVQSFGEASDRFANRDYTAWPSASAKRCDGICDATNEKRTQPAVDREAPR
jgi:hypothetical protein